MYILRTAAIYGDVLGFSGSGVMLRDRSAEFWVVGLRQGISGFGRQSWSIDSYVLQDLKPNIGVARIANSISLLSLNPKP